MKLFALVFRASLLVSIAAAAVGCGKKIGDGCRVSDDCVTTQTDRQCDNSQPGGYCTIVGCDERSCPEDSACVRFFPSVFDTQRACDPAVVLDGPGSCPPEDLCLPIAQAAGSPGVCVARTAERRFCVRTCGNSGDCRDEYECRETAAPASVPYTGDRVKFCAPKPQQ